MPRQNRVTPNGDLVAVAAEGTLMGNRGVLHNSEGQLTSKRWTHQQWIICLLEFNGRQREIMSPGCYTELFFLDEATALAAGHRPCWECNRERYNTYKTAWLKGNPEYGFLPKVSIKEIDRVLHQERTPDARTRNPFHTKLGGLPDGIFVTLPDTPEEYYLFHNEKLRLWSPAGYVSDRVGNPDQQVNVITPKSTVNAIKAGYKVFE